MDNYTLTTGPDNHMINISEENELEYWSKKFNISPEKLKSAVRAVGSSVAAISKYLHKN